MTPDIVATDAVEQVCRDAPPTVDHYFMLLTSLMHGIRATVGQHCEVVLHDFRDPEHSIIAIEGDITRRHVGGTMSQIGISLMAQGSAAEDQLNYVTRSPNGRVLKSTTIPLRDAGGHVFGAFCVNVDVTELRLLAGFVSELAGSSHVAPQPIAFADDIGQVIRAIIDEEEALLGNSIDRMTKRDRMSIFRALDRRGIFSLQRAVPQVAEYLGISRATAYAYLEEIRQPDPAADNSENH